MTGAIDGASLGHPQAIVTLFGEFADTGLMVTGLPTGWRKVRRDADLVTVSDLWLSESEAEQQESLAPSERFVSNAMATAWRIADLPVPAADLLGFAEAMTFATSGWELRERVADPVDDRSSVLLGSLESPFGTLVSNAHSVVIPVGEAEFILAQLAVTARAPYVDGADEPRLAPSAPQQGLRRVSFCDMADWREETVESLRGLILAADGRVVEEIKWRKPSNPDGVPTFSLDGLICTLETYKDKVKVTFAKGASLPDPSNVFNASLTAGTRRAIDITQTDTIDPGAFTAIVQAAIAANRA